jgi:hypothetical protein
MMPLPKTFQSFAEFEREILRGSTRLGLSLEEIVEDDSFDAEIEVDSDDPFEAMRDGKY